MRTLLYKMASIMPICNSMKKYILPVAEGVPALKLREFQRQNDFMKEMISFWKEHRKECAK